MIRACLSIAVSRPEGNLPVLPGAVTAARGVAAWAHAAGFDRVETVTDAGPGNGGPEGKGSGAAVSAALLQRTLTAMINGGGVDHLVVHFAGHSLHDEYDEPLLLLTGGLSDPAEAIDLRRFVRLLEFHSVRRLSLLIDACRSDRPAAKDLKGSGILEGRAMARQEFLEDRFRTVRAGRDAFTIRDPAGGGAACSLFSAVLLKTLHGDYADVIEMRGAAPAVTSASIYRALSQRLRAAAASYRLTVEPGLKPGFAPAEDVYNLLPAAFAAPELPAPKRRLATGVLGALFGRLFDPSVRSRSNVPPRPLWAHDDERPRLLRDRRQGLVILDTEPQAPRRIVVSPPARMSFLAAEHLNINTERRWSRSAQSYEFHQTSGGRSRGSPALPASFLAEMDDGLWVGAACWPGMAVAISSAPLIREVATPRGPRLIYGPAKAADYQLGGDRPGAYEEIFEGCELILSELTTGLAAYRQAAYVAGLVWHFKQRFAHVNPLLGVIAAWLYDAAGDRDGIKRLASLYPEHRQPVPFDIALLAGLPGRRGRDGLTRIDLPALPARMPRTDEEAASFVDVRRFGLFAPRRAVRDAVVAGGFPWMRQGWGLLDLAGFPVHAGVIELAGNVGPTLFTTLDRDGGRRLAALIDRGEV
jgi:hypothetical protein